MKKRGNKSIIVNNNALLRAVNMVANSKEVPSRKDAIKKIVKIYNSKTGSDVSKSWMVAKLRNIKLYNKLPKKVFGVKKHNHNFGVIETIIDVSVDVINDGTIKKNIRKFGYGDYDIVRLYTYQYSKKAKYIGNIKYEDCKDINFWRRVSSLVIKSHYDDGNDDSIKVKLWI